MWMVVLLQLNVLASELQAMGPMSRLRDRKVNDAIFMAWFLSEQEFLVQSFTNDVVV
jgi:hypothetical protein